MRFKLLSFPRKRESKNLRSPLNACGDDIISGYPLCNHKGFTLIEVMIAVVILGICAGSLLLVMANVTEKTVFPEVLNTANYLLEQEMERVTGLRYSAITDEGPTAYTGDFSSYSYQITVSAVPAALASDAGMTDYKQVQIAVIHNRVGTISATTVVTNN